MNDQARDAEVVNDLPQIIAATGETDTQVATAHRYPRNIPKFLKTLEDMVTGTQEAAEDCMYHLERKGRGDDGSSTTKDIYGPSIRFAESVGALYGNLRVKSGVSEIGEKYVKTYGACWDLESNYAEEMTDLRKITTRSGARFSEDMAVMNARASRAISKREAILKTVPKILWQPIFLKAQAKALGKAVDLPVMRQVMIDSYGKLGVKPAQLLAKMRRSKIEDLTLEDVMALRVDGRAIRDGEKTIEEVFGPTAGASSTAQSDDIAAKLKEKEDAERAAAAAAGASSTAGADAKNSNEEKKGTSR